MEGDRARPGVFYAGVAGAGLWRTTDFGASWVPIFEAPPSGDVTAVALARSAPGVVYAAVDTTEDAARVFSSKDAGATWTPVVVAGAGAVTRVALDPGNALRLFVSLARNGDNEVVHDTLMSTDGGRSFVQIARVRGHAALTGVFVDPVRPSLVLALDSADAPTPTLRRSTDGGATWLPADESRTLPVFDSGLRHVDIAAGADGRIFLLAAGNAGLQLFTSTTAAQTWSRVAAVFPVDMAVVDTPRLGVTPSGRLLIATGALLASTDGPESFSRVPHVPAGRVDDFVWAHPTMPGVFMLGGDSGAIVTVNDAETWSQPRALAAAAVDRISVDTAFPYRICADDRVAINCTEAWRDAASGTGWQTLPRHVTGPVLADPLDADMLVAGDLVRYDRRTGQRQEISHSGVSTARSTPVAKVFSPDGRTLYVAGEGVWRTTNSGLDWTDISPASVRLSTTGVTPRVSAMAVSPIDTRTLWAGLDDGRLLVTRDGGITWETRDPPVEGLNVAIRGIEPSRFDTSSAYVVLSPDDKEVPTPRLLRTRDLGATWVNVGTWIAGARRVNVVREDPFRRGLLFAGTDRSVFVSFDDGGAWQPLRLNLPAVPVTDLALKDADLIAATSGRGVWLLEDLTPLRQITTDVARAAVFLFRPPQAWRVRAGDTSVPVERSAAEGATRGATFTYLLGDAVTDSIALEVVDTTTGDLIRRFTSRPGDSVSESTGATRLATTPGLHRVTWDLRYAAPTPGSVGEGAAPPGTGALPGTYQVRLTVDGRNVRQAITIRMDPRVRTSILDLTAQRDLGRAIDAARAAVHAARTAPGPGGTPPAPTARQRSLASLAAELNQLADVLQQADVRPGPRVEAAVEAAIARTAAVLGVDGD